MDLDKYFAVKGITGGMQRGIAPETAETLRTFCEQEPEFSQSIEQSGKTYQQCLDYVVEAAKKDNNVGTLSDHKAFCHAVDFYFPGAKVRRQMWIDLVGDADAPEQEAKTLSAKFDSLMDW